MKSGCSLTLSAVVYEDADKQKLNGVENVYFHINVGIGYFTITLWPVI